MAHELLTINEYKERVGIDLTDTRDDDLHSAAIKSASAAITRYTGRDFGESGITEQRTYQYDGSGVIDIDDATDVTAVTIEVGDNISTTLVPDTQWYPQPHRTGLTPVYTYIVLPPGMGTFQSPQMGFERNLDVYAKEGRWSGPPTIAKVDGTWGWPEIPEDVKQAAVWTVQEFSTTDDQLSESLVSESIEGFSRSWNKQAQPLAIPNRAKDILVTYLRWTF